MNTRTAPPQPPSTGADPRSELALYAQPQARPKPTLRRLSFIAFGISVLGWAATYLAGKIPPTNPPRQNLIDILSATAPPTGWAAAGAGVLLTAATLTSHRIRSRHAQLRNTMAHALAFNPAHLRIKSKWKDGYLTWARVRYPRRLPLRYDPDDAFLKALGRQMRGVDQATAEHDPKSRTITFVPKPPEPEDLPDWWHLEGHDNEVVKRLDAMRSSLAGFLGEAALDRERTKIGPYGQIEKITATYPSTTTRDTNDQFLARVRKVLAQKVPSPTGSWSLTWIPHEGEVIIIPSVQMPERVLNPGLPTERGHPHMLPLGVRRTGDPAFWCPHKFPHLLFSGQTGGGKSVVIRTLLVMALMNSWDVYLCDAKKVGYRRGFAEGWGISHERIATTGRHMESVILAIYNEMDRRYQRIEWGGADLRDFTPILLIVDENTEALTIMNKWAKKVYAKDHKKQAPRNLQSEAVDAEWSIARLGREVGVYLVLAHQRPDVIYIPGEARDNMTSRLATGPLKPSGLNMLFDSYNVEQQIFKRIQLPDGSFDVVPVTGRSTAQLGNGPEPVQVYWTPKPDDADNSEEEQTRLEWLRSHCEAAQDQAAHPLLPGIVTPSPNDSDDPDTDGDSQPSIADLRRQQTNQTAGELPSTAGSDKSESTGATPQGSGAGTNAGEQVLVTNLQEGDQVWFDVTGDEVEIEVLGLLDGAPGEIELEYQIIQTDHPETGVAQAVALDEDTWLPRVETTP